MRKACSAEGCGLHVMQFQCVAKHLGHKPYHLCQAKPTLKRLPALTNGDVWSQSTNSVGMLWGIVGRIAPAEDAVLLKVPAWAAVPLQLSALGTTKPYGYFRSKGCLKLLHMFAPTVCNTCTFRYAH